jgi:hypothetical protein
VLQRKNDEVENDSVYDSELAVGMKVRNKEKRSLK